MISPIDLILGDPNPLMLQALAEIFDRDRRFSLIASSKTAEGFLEACLRAPVPLGVIDWSLPLLGAERLLAILRDRPKPPRIVIYASSNDPDIPRRAMAAGAAGFCTRDTAPEQLLDIVATVAAGRMVFPLLDVRARNATHARSLRTAKKPCCRRRGRTNSELAKELGISINTVNFIYATSMKSSVSGAVPRPLRFTARMARKAIKPARVNPSTDDIFRQQLSHGDCGMLQLATSLWATQH